MSPIPLPNQTEDTAAQQNFDEIAGYLSGTAEAVALAKRDAAIALKAAATQPAAQVTNSSNQSIPNVTTTLLAFDTEFLDNNGIHDNVTNNSRLTCRTAGLYAVFANIHWAGGTGSGFTYIYVNGVRTTANENTGDRGQVTLFPVLSVGDYVEAQVLQGSGGALNVLASGTTFSMSRLSGV